MIAVSHASVRVTTNPLHSGRSRWTMVRVLHIHFLFIKSWNIPVREHIRCPFCMWEKWSSEKFYVRPLELDSARSMSSGCLLSDYLCQVLLLHHSEEWSWKFWEWGENTFSRPIIFLPQYVPPKVCFQRHNDISSLPKWNSSRNLLKSIYPNNVV